MDNRSFESLTRIAADGVSRRGSLMTLAATGLAVLAGPFTTEAKNKQKRGKKDKNKKKQSAPPPPPELCAPQVEECAALFTELCDNGPNCQPLVACCSHLGTCDAGAFVLCFATSL